MKLNVNYKHIDGILKVKEFFGIDDRKLINFVFFYCYKYDTDPYFYNQDLSIDEITVEMASLFFDHDDKDKLIKLAEYYRNKNIMGESNRRRYKALQDNKIKRNNKID